MITVTLFVISFNFTTDLYEIYDIAKKNRKPIFNLGQRNTGRKSVFASICATRKPAFYSEYNCNTNKKPTSYMQINLLNYCMHNKSSSHVCTSSSWTHTFEKILRHDFETAKQNGISLMGRPFSNAPTLSKVYIKSFTPILTIRHSRSLKQRIKKTTLVCVDIKFRFDFYSCAKHCGYRFIYDCFTKIDDTYKHNQINQRYIKLFIPKIINLFTKKNVDLTISNVINNEAHRIKYWIEYHRARGVGKFVIYDNYSKDNIKQKLQEYIHDNIVDFYSSNFSFS